MTEVSVDIPQLAALIQELEAWIATHDGMLPQEAFELLPRVIPQACIELAVIKIIDGAPHILLVPRPEDDVYWPGELHVPGTVLWARGGHEAMLARLAEEIGVPELKWSWLEPVDVYVTSHEERERGACWHDIRLLRVASAFKAQTFYPLSALPDRIIAHHLPILEIVRRHLL